MAEATEAGVGPRDLVLSTLGQGWFSFGDPMEELLKLGVGAFWGSAVVMAGAEWTSPADDPAAAMEVVGTTKLVLGRASKL